MRRRALLVIAATLASCGPSPQPSRAYPSGVAERWRAVRPLVVAEAEAPSDIDGPPTEPERVWLVRTYEELRAIEARGRDAERGPSPACSRRSAATSARLLELHAELAVRRLTLAGVGEMRGAANGPLGGCAGCAPGAVVACDLARDLLDDAAEDMREAGILPAKPAMKAGTGSAPPPVPIRREAPF